MMNQRKIEKAAEAIKFLVPLNGHDPNCGKEIGWTEKGLQTVKWPRDFTKQERKLIRTIAKTALGAVR